MDVERKLKRAEAAGDGFFTRADDKQHSAADPHSGDSTYLATVHVRFTDSGLPPVSFDVRRDRRDLLSFNMLQSDHTTTYLHIGYSHSEGGIAGLRFAWHF